MDAIVATLITVSGDIPATIEFYKNYFYLKGWIHGPNTV